MGFNLGQFLHGVEAQINPFDHGQTFATVTRNQPPKQAPPPASTARPQINTRQLTNQVNNMANIGPAAVAKQPGTPAMNITNPIIGTAQAIWDKLEGNNQHFRSTPLPQTRAEANAQIRDRNSPFFKSSLDMAGNSLSGESKFATDLSRNAVAKLSNTVAKFLPHGDTTPAPIIGPKLPSPEPPPAGPVNQTPKAQSSPAVPAPKAPATKTRGLTTGIQQSPNFSPELQGAVKSEYTPFTNKEALAGEAKFAAQGLDQANAQALSHLSSSAPVGKQEVVNFGKTLQALDAAGRTEEANTLHNLLAKKLTEAGQTGQAASLLYQRTPEGLRNLAYRDLRNAKVPITDAIKNEIDGHINTIKGMPEGPGKDFATAVLQKAVAKHMPQSAVGNAVSVWKAGLLSGVKTQGGNFVSNATFGALKAASDPLATGLDKAASVVTGQRTKTLTGKGIVSGTGEGLKNGVTTMKTGIDMRNVGNKYEQHAEINFGNPVIQKIFGDPSNMVFRGMSAADQPFYYSALKNSLYDQAKADGINAGLRGKALSQHMDNLVKSPNENMVNTAVEEANKAVLGNDTFASKAIAGAHRGIDNMDAPPMAKAAAHAVLHVLAPFTKVPSAFLSRTVDFTPFGPIKTVVGQIMKKQFNQRALVQAISEGATGTGLIGMGIALSHSGQLSGDYPKNNSKEQARWKAEGITPNSVKMGGKWVSLNYLGPVGILFNIGDKLSQTRAQGADTSTQVGAALAGLGQGLMGQSFLQGFSGFSDAINNPARNAGSFVNSQAGSVVPAWINDISNATDNMQRQVNGPAQAIQGRIPGAREQLSPKIDVFGNNLQQASGSGLQTAVNPLKPSNSIDNPMYQELNRLDKAGQSVFPTPSKTIGQGADQIKLTPDQQNQRQKLFGQMITPVWTQIMQSPDYKQLDDAHKKTVLDAALTDVNSAVDRKLTAQIDSSKLGKPATGSVADILTGHGPTAADYLAKVQGKPQNPQQQYQRDAAAFQRKQSEGKLTAVQSFRGQESLKREAITSKFPQDVVDFYNLSKADMNAYFKQDPQKAKQLYDQARTLDGQLTQQLGSTTKFKYGLGTKPKKAKAARTHKAGTVKSTSKGGFNYAKLTAVKASSTDTGALRKLVGAPKFTRKAVKAAKAPSGKLKKIKASKIA